MRIGRKIQSSFKGAVIDILVISSVSLFLVCSIAYSSPTTSEIKKDVMLYDLRHRQPVQQTLIEGHLRTGYFDSMRGRYLPFDRAHGNGYALFRLLFSDKFSFRTSRQPITREVLDGVSILLLINPDSEAYLDTAHLISDEEIRAITEFVRAGGGLFVTANSWTKPETYELDHTNKLLRHFGVEFQQDWTPYYKCRVPEDSPFLFNVSALHYGGGCTIRVLDDVPGVKLDVVLEAKKDEMKRSNVYPVGYQDAPLGEGPIITLSHYGRGRVIAVGDSGTWGHDDLAVTGAGNLEILKQLMGLLSGKGGMDLQYRPTPGKRSQYSVEVSRFIAAPDPDLLKLFTQPRGVKKELLSAGSWPSEFLYHLAEYELDRSAGQKDARGNTELSLDLYDRRGNQKHRRGSVKFDLAPRGQVVRKRFSPNAIEPLSVLHELANSVSVPFSDPSIEVGSSWENDLWVRILPLELGKESAAWKKVKAKHILEGIEERRGARCLKVVTYAVVDMEGVEISALLSAETLHRPQVERFRVDQGMQVMERVQYLTLDKSELVESESYLYSRLWLDGLGFRGDDQGFVQLHEQIMVKPR